MLRSLTTAMLLVSQCALAQISSDQSTEIMNRVADEFAIPRYVKLAESASQLSSDIAQLCEAPSPENLTYAQTQFRYVVESYGGIEMLRFGSILAENRLERLLFFPDRKSTGLKRVQRLLANEKPDYLNEGGLIGISVAAQGLPALEFALFGTGSEVLIQQAQSYRCQYSLAVARNIEDIVQTFAREWQSDILFMQMWRAPGIDNPVFNNSDHVVTHLVTTMVHGLEEVRNVRLLAFLKAEAAQDRSRSAPLWRSGNTFPLLLADVKSMHALFKAIRFQDYLGDGFDLQAASINAQFLTLIEMLEADQPVKELLSDANQRAKLIKLAAHLKVLMNTLEQDLGGHLNVRVGFFFADGD